MTGLASLCRSQCVSLDSSAQCWLAIATSYRANEPRDTEVETRKDRTTRQRKHATEWQQNTNKHGASQQIAISIRRASASRGGSRPVAKVGWGRSSLSSTFPRLRSCFSTSNSQEGACCCFTLLSYPLRYQHILCVLSARDLALACLCEPQEPHLAHLYFSSA